STRNLGAAISTQNLSRLMLQSRRFLARPSIDFFKEITSRERSKKATNDLLERTLVVSFKNKPRSVDILWGQLYKSLDALASKIELRGFTILRKKASSNETNESAFIFLLLETKISKYQLRIGPDVFRSEDFAKYMEKNRKKANLSWLDSDGRVESIFEREKDSNDIFKELKRVLSDQQKVDSIGLSRAIKDEIRKFRIQSGAAVVRTWTVGKSWLQNDVISVTSKEDVLDAEI
ncbi:MAG: hypothetical protein PXY39_06705, partial [archaeon]|nr:hypothetical protein [archaeon]